MRAKAGYLAGLAALAGCAIIVHAGPSGGTVSGKVTYEGTPAKQKPIDMSKEPSCAKQHTTPITTETVVTGPATLSTTSWFTSRPGLQTITRRASQPNSIRRAANIFLTSWRFQVNQPLEIANDDQTSHNIHPLPKVNREWNKSQPPGSAPIIDKYDKPEFIPVKCNIHPWMHGNFAVLKNSHYAITQGEGGFSLAKSPSWEIHHHGMA